MIFNKIMSPYNKLVRDKIPEILDKRGKNKTPPNVGGAEIKPATVAWLAISEFGRRLVIANLSPAALRTFFGGLR
jgi:hypothetical protein